MPEPIPTTDTKGKKLSKNAIILIVVGGGAFLLWYKAKKKKEEENGPPPGTNAYTAQSFIPVTGENVAGAGASGGGSTVLREPEANQALIKAEEENLKTIAAYLTSAQKPYSESEHERQPVTINVTGGGPPSNSQPGSASPPSGGSPGSKPPPPHGTSKCPSSHPHSGPHGCYRDEIDPHNHAYVCHIYQNGTKECVHK